MSTQLSSSTQKPRTNLDPLFRLITRCFAFLVLALLAAILLSLIQGATPAIKHFGLGIVVIAMVGKEILCFEHCLVDVLDHSVKSSR